MKGNKPYFGRSGVMFGGALLKSSHPKGKRPLSKNQPIEVVLQMNEAMTKSTWPPLLGSFRKIEERVNELAKKNQIRIQQMLNGGTYLHLIVKLPKKSRRFRQLYNNFIRALSGEVVRLVTGARKRRPASVTSLYFKSNSGSNDPPNLGKNSQQSFWKQRPYTRILKQSSKLTRELRLTLSRAQHLLQSFIMSLEKQKLDLSKQREGILPSLPAAPPYF